MPPGDPGKALQGVSGQDTVDTIGLHLQVQPTLASCERCTGLAATICRFWSFNCSYHFIVDNFMYFTPHFSDHRILMDFDLIYLIYSDRNDPVIMNPASPFACSSVLFRFVLPCLPAVHVICRKRWVAWRQDTPQRCWFIWNDVKGSLVADFVTILLTIYFPIGRQPTQVTYGWAIGEIKVFDDPNCQNPLTPISATGYETTWGLPGDFRSCMNTELWRTINRLLELQCIIQGSPGCSMWIAGWLHRIGPLMATLTPNGAHPATFANPKRPGQVFAPAEPWMKSRLWFDWKKSYYSDDYDWICDDWCFGNDNLMVMGTGKPQPAPSTEHLRSKGIVMSMCEIHDNNLYQLFSRVLQGCAMPSIGTHPHKDIEEDLNLEIWSLVFCDAEWCCRRGWLCTSTFRCHVGVAFGTMIFFDSVFSWNFTCIVLAVIPTLQSNSYTSHKWLGSASSCISKRS